ncbi:MAG: peptidoglycan DD-metalloendopeptidase family protein [bacterium]|nr:peptidoglycan DD-metalloendopeptidase family protein [bacterium]
MKKYIALIILLFLILIPFYNIQAKTLNDLKSELSSMKSKYEKNEQSKKMTEDEISKVKGEIESINNQIDTLNSEIDELNLDIERRNKEIDTMREEIKSIVHYYQIASSESFYLEYVFKAKSYTDFIYRLAVSEQLSEYRKKKIDEFNALIEENKKKIEALASKKVELDKLHSELSSKFKKLETELTGIEIAGVNIKDEIKDLEKTINLYENTYKCSNTEELTACVNRHNTSSRTSSKSAVNYNVPSASGFYVPITYWTHIYEFHDHDNGLDLSTPEGQAVHPIADGVVVDIWYQYNCGGNMVWIAHNVNGQKYTSAYFHLSSVNVSLDQQVSHNSVIGYSGGIRRGSSYNYYDNCTTGPHLHLQVATGHYDRIVRSSWDGNIHISYSAWNARSINPRNIINF